MTENFMESMSRFYEQNIVTYMRTLYEYPTQLISLVLDLAIVVFLLYEVVKIAKDTRMWQLLRGIVLLIGFTFLSDWLNLNILNYILTFVYDYGVIVLIVIFQPELRRALEQLGTSRIKKFFGFDKDFESKIKESIYRVVIAASEFSKSKVGALIVFERNIKIRDIVNTGIPIESEITPQLLVNIFMPNTPLHDGAVVISNNKIAAAACMLPLAGDADISKDLGTRHRAAVGMSKESDAIVVVVSEETGKTSIAKDGTLIADVKSETLKKILIKALVAKENKKEEESLFEKMRNKFMKKK